MSLLSGLYVVTDQELRSGRTHADIASAAIEGGARIIQLRDKNATDREFYKAAVDLRKITSAAGALFLINDRIDVAAAVSADGVNIGQSDLPLVVARRILGRRAIIGVSADNIDQARRAELDGADYVGFGPVYATTTKLDAGPVSGLEMLRQVSRMLDIPVVAIGGINPENIAAVAGTGAACAAVVSAVVCAEDMAAVTAQLIDSLKAGRQVDSA